ncbi:hypothetical protein HT105_23390, partial [Bacteroides fragilis]|nr:hypothetical protein [Bacteroides fragilis]
AASRLGRIPGNLLGPPRVLTRSCKTAGEATGKHDASPFFRIFNPQLQASKFDPDGTYVRQWAPPLSPPPIVDLKQSRQAALDAYQEIC